MRVVVVGAGIVGLATADALVRRGLEVTVLEAGRPMAARSAGASRIFRLTHDATAYVVAAQESRALWAELARRAGRDLVGTEGAVVSGPRAAGRAAAMSAAGADHRLGDPPPGLLGRVEGPVLHDPAGGALDLAAAGRALLGALGPRVRRGVRAGQVGTTGRVTTTADHRPDGVLAADAVVVAAGAGTAPLVRPLGIDAPAGLRHHLRFAFRVRAGSGPLPPCHLDGTGHGELTSTYQHRTPEGHWAVGGSFAEEPSTLHGFDAARDRSLAAVTAHVAARLPELDPEPVDELACTPATVNDDGVTFARAGAVHAVYGENLAKLAPLLAQRLADGVVRDEVAYAIGE